MTSHQDQDYSPRGPGDDDLMEPAGDLAEPGEPIDPDAEGSPEPGDAEVVIVAEIVDDPPERYPSARTGPAANASQTASSQRAGSGLGRDSTTSAHEGDAAVSLDLTTQWHDIQAGFVDDPPGAVRLAEQAAEDALGVLIASLRKRQSALAPVTADSSGDQDTERLRGALRDYRVLCQHAEEIGQQITRL